MRKAAFLTGKRPLNLIGVVRIRPLIFYKPIRLIIEQRERPPLGLTDIAHALPAGLARGGGTDVEDAVDADGGAVLLAQEEGPDASVEAEVRADFDVVLVRVFGTAHGFTSHHFFEKSRIA